MSTGTNAPAIRWSATSRFAGSLSKAFGIIERFSEDVDIVIPVLATPDATVPSKSGRQAALKAATSGVTTALHIPNERAGGREGVDLHWRWTYPSQYPLPSGLEQYVRVELTVMGGDQPAAARTVRSMLAEHVSVDPAFVGFPDYSDLASIEALTLAPERTLVEKLAMLHDAASKRHDQRLVKGGRHFYDVACLLKHGPVIEQLTPENVAALAADADRWSERGRYAFEPRPDNGFGCSPAFQDRSLRPYIEQGYNDAMMWVWSDDKPSLQECLDGVEAAAHLL